MTDEMIVLAKRAVACPKWRWMPGMRTFDAMRVIHDPARWPDRPCAIREGGWVDTAPPRPLKDDLPDLCDSATLGCLLTLVRGAWDIPSLSLSPWSDGWEYAWKPYVKKGPCGYWFTEAEALVAALEGAP